jgi:hypothetical protein
MFAKYFESDALVTQVMNVLVDVFARQIYCSIAER